MPRTMTAVTRTGIVAILALFAAAALYPILFMFFTSFRTSVEYTNNPLAWPQSFTYVDNFVSMFRNFDVIHLFLNTILYIALAAAISLLVSVPAAFAIAKLRFPLKRLLFIAIITSMVIPAITFIIPDYILMTDFNLVDNLWSVVLLWAATSVPGSIFLLSALTRSLPNELVEATKVDGANYFHMMIRVVIPMIVPGIVTITIFNVTTWWNDLLIPLIFLQSDTNKTMTAAVATIVGRYSTDYPQLMAGLLMAALPPVLIYIFLQSYIRRGMVMGAVK
jgi:ABC-type glycerol-3-phosphate transport system permease component